MPYPPCHLLALVYFPFWVIFWLLFNFYFLFCLYSSMGKKSCSPSDIKGRKGKKKRKKALISSGFPVFLFSLFSHPLAVLLRTICGLLCQFLLLCTFPSMLLIIVLTFYSCITCLYLILAPEGSVSANLVLAPSFPELCLAGSPGHMVHVCHVQSLYMNE